MRAVSRDRRARRQRGPSAPDRRGIAAELGAQPGCQERVRGLRERLETLHAHQADLNRQLAPDGHTTPDAAELSDLADQIEAILTTEGPEQAKELLRQLIKEIRVHNRRRIIPTYRVPAAVRTTPSKVELKRSEPLTFSLRTRRQAPILGAMGAQMEPGVPVKERHPGQHDELLVPGNDLRRGIDLRMSEARACAPPARCWPSRSPDAQVCLDGTFKNPCWIADYSGF